MELENLLSYSEEVPLYGLSLMILLAGVTKFTHPSFWLGFEPEVVVNLLPLTAENLMHLGGIFEVALGALLLARWKTWQVASILTVWLAAITVQVASMGAYSLAIRDLGLVALAYTVAAQHYKS